MAGLSHDLPVHAALRECSYWLQGQPIILGEPKSLDQLRILAIAEHLDRQHELLLQPSHKATIEAGRPLPLAGLKLSHHGSFKNLTKEMLEGINCRRYLVSTDGSVHHHPDHQALLRILKYSTTRPLLGAVTLPPALI